MPTTPAALPITTRKLFISHASTDNAFGFELVDRLRAAGLDVWYDSRGFTPDGIGWEGGIHPAHYWEQEIFRELRARPVFVVLLSAAALDSAWVQDEILLAWKQKNERGRTEPKVLVPVIVPQGSLIPEPLDLVQAVSFVPRPDWSDAQAFEALLVAIRAERTQVRPGESEPPFELATLPPPEHFVGREADLAWLLERLRPGATAGITAVRGMGGIGKTALAAEVIQRAFEDGRFPSGIAVQVCTNLRDPVVLLQQILASFDPERRQPEAQELKGLAEVAQHRLHGRRTLIVLDNIEPDDPDPEGAWKLERVVTPLRQAGAALLLTARQVLPRAAVPLEASHEVKLLAPDEALELFAQSYGRASAAQLAPDEHAGAVRILAILDRHTLAVKLAGAYAADLHRPLDTLAEELAVDPLKPPDGETPRAVARVLDRSVDALPEGGQRLFAALAAFATNEFGREAALTLAMALKLSESESNVELLVRRALLDVSENDVLLEVRDRERLRLHPLLRAYATTLLNNWPADARAAAYQATAEWYAAYAGNISDAGRGVDEANISGALVWAHEHGQVEQVAVTCMGMQYYWRDRGKTAKSLRYLAWGVTAAESIASRTDANHGEERKWRLRAAHLALSYGEALQTVGRTDEADRAYQSNLAIRRDMHDRQGEGAVLSKLGEVARVRGRLEDAELYFQQSLAIRRQVHDRHGEGTVLTNLGHVEQSRGQLKQAERYYQRALAILHQTHDRHGEGAMLSNLGSIAQGRGQPEQAEQYYQQALVILRQIEDRQGEAVVLSNLGSIAQGRGQPEQAERYLQQSLAIRQEVHDRQGEAVALSNLGSVAQSRGQLEAAEGYYQQALAIAREVQDRQGEGVVLSNLGEVAQHRTQLESAERYFLQALAIVCEVQDRHGEAVVLTNLGLIAQQRGQLDQAEHHYQQSLAIRREVLDRKGEGMVLSGLGKLALARRQVEQAEQRFQQSLAIVSEVHDRQGEGVVRAYLGSIAESRKLWAAAEDYYRQAVDIAREIQDAATEATSSLTLAKLFIKRRTQQEEAHRLLERAIVLFEQMGLQAQAAEARAFVQRLGCVE